MPRRPLRRGLAWAVSITVHVALILALVLGIHVAEHEAPIDPHRLVFIEPAPPPPPPAPPQAEAIAAEEVRLPLQELPPESARLIEAKATRKPTTTPRPATPPTVTPRPTARPAARAAAAPTAVAPLAAGGGGVDVAGGSAGGTEGGLTGGTEGGVTGGVVGGRGTEVVRAEVAAKPPMIVERTLPEYPVEARAKRIEGQVLLRAIVGEDGRVEDDVVVLRSAPPFDEPAVAALRQWRFTPGRDREGKAVRVQIDVPMRFQLK